MEKKLWAISQPVKDVIPEELYAKLTSRARQLFEGDLIDLPYKEEATATSFKEIEE
jgi:hypothetical protein